MARIGTVIREVYHRPGAGALPAHLADRYGIRVAGTARLTEGVFRVDRDAGPPWVARIMLTGRPRSRTEGDAEILHFLERREFPAERCAAPNPVTELGGRAVLVTEYLPGKHPSGSPAVWRKLGDLLGRLHTLPAEPGPARRQARCTTCRSTRAARAPISPRPPRCWPISTGVSRPSTGSSTS